MSVNELMVQWEEALVGAVSRPEKGDTLSKCDLEEASGIAVRSNVRAGDTEKTWDYQCITSAFDC